MVCGADDTLERRSGRQIKAKGGYRDAGRSSKKHVIRCFGLQGVSMLLLVPEPWSRRVWALPLLTALGWPAEQGGQRRHKTSGDGVRQLMKPVRRWLPDRWLVLVVDGGFAPGSLALACVNNRVTLGSRLRWDAALDHPPAPPPQGNRGPKPTQGKRQRRWQGWAERSDTPWKTVAGNGYGGQRKQVWGFSRTALWSPLRLPPVAIRSVVLADPEGKLRMEAFCCTDLEATPEQSLQRVVMRWSVEVTFEEGRAHLGLEPQRQWSTQAIAHATPVLLALFSLVTVLALRLSQDGQIPVPVTA
jgi:hypothetical protein